MSEANKVAFVTGGSRGIGKAIALDLAKQGYDIVVNYANNVDAANATVEEIKKLGVDALAIKCNVSDKDSVNDMVKEIIEKYKKVDVLVNNAGITRDNLIIRMKESDWESVINTNLNSIFYLTKPIVKLMMKQRAGSIVNISSICGVYGNAGQTNYSSAKAGLIGFTKALSKEVAARGITVNAVAPGFIETDMTDNLDKENIAKNIPLGKLGKPEDIASVVRFLAEEGKYITGQVISVDGGLVI